MASTFIFLGLLIFCAHLFSFLFSKRRIPDVLLLLSIGIVIGPVFGWLTPESFGQIGPVFASLTLVFILLDSGIDMSINALRRSWKGFVQVTISSFLLSMGVIAVMAHYMGFDWYAGALLGAMLAGTGASIVIPLVNQMRVEEETRTVLTLESAISAVLCIVVSLAIIEGFKMGKMNLPVLCGKVIASVMMALILGVIGGILWASLLERIRRLRNSMFLTPAFVFVIYGLTEMLGYSGAISALAFGIVLGNTSYFEFSFMRKMSHRKMMPLQENEKSFFKELVFVFKTFFFVYIGICIPFTNTTALCYGFLIAAVLFVARFVLIAIVGRNNTRNDRLVVSMMIPKGLASAVLASVPEQVNLAAGYTIIPGAAMIKHITYAVIFFSIVITSLLVLLTRKRTMQDEPPDEMHTEVYNYE